MDIDMIFRIAAIGILLSALAMVLRRSGREDMADLVLLGGLVIVLLIVVTSISSLFDNMKSLFFL